MAAPVRGLRPVVALRVLTEKLPNPVSRTSRPSRSAVSIALEHRVDGLRRFCRGELGLVSDQADDAGTIEG